MSAAHLVPDHPTDQQIIAWYEVEPNTLGLRHVTAQYHVNTSWEDYRTRYGHPVERGTTIQSEWMLPMGRSYSDQLRRMLDRAVCFATLEEARDEALMRLDDRIDGLLEQIEDARTTRDKVAAGEFYSMKPWGVK